VENHSGKARHADIFEDHHDEANLSNWTDVRIIYYPSFSPPLARRSTAAY
jgi:hypothetical protein